MKTLQFFIGTLILMLAASFAAMAQVNLTSLDGSKVNIEALNGKVVVLAIGASWLPLSDKQAEYTNALVKKYAGKNVVFYFVATDSTNPKSKNFASTEDIRKFAFENKLNIPVLRDSDGAATIKKFHIEQVPSFVILDKTGSMTSDPFGGIDPKYDITIAISKVIDRML